ncbi:MAG: response regulator transcription factor [Clostridia bacterium]|nr:response regulator transcription factor [Clostridia bacterium]
MTKPAISVLVIDDHQLIIDGLKLIFEVEQNIVFAGGANNMEEALNFLSKNQVDVVLADISMPGHSGIEVTKKIKEIYPEIQVLALTMHEDIAMISAMIEAGASGYLLKRANMNEVVEAIHTVAKKKKYLGGEVQAILMDDLIHREPTEATAKSNSGELTRREKEILNLVAKEFNNEEIANKLFISERTVETHRRNIFTKTNTKSIVGLIKYALRTGLISQDNEAQTDL